MFSVNPIFVINLLRKADEAPFLRRGDWEGLDKSVIRGVGYIGQMYIND